jgi:hypothetical protein
MLDIAGWPMDRFVRRENIKHLREMLERTTDEALRRQLQKLLDEELQKQKDAGDKPAVNDPA